MRFLYTAVSMGLFLLTAPSFSQIVTRQIENERIQSRLPFGAKPTLPVKEFRVNEAEVQSLQKQDSVEQKLGGFPFRFGKGFKTDLSLSDGTWTELSEGKGRVWQLQISSPNAFSLNFLFDKFELVKGAELTLYNAERTMQMGPITAEHNNEFKLLSTDLIKGNSVIIELFEPGNVVEHSNFHISKVVHGYQNMFNVGGYGQSLNCEVNALCFTGSAYHAQTNSVALVLLGQERICTSTLLTTACQNFRPYMLTAFHCLDTGSEPCDIDYQNGAVSQTEINSAQSWTFRFQYKSPNCSPTSEPSVTYSYSGATFRAGNAASDFALLEMTNAPNPGTGIHYAGWNRSTNAPSSAGVLHHPMGDVMKVSLANSSVLRDNALGINICGDTRTVNYPANSLWELTLNSGALEGGSSGAAYFDPNGRVFGQHTAGASVCNNNTKFGGAFHVSWTGGGTAATRLSDWLDPSGTGATTTNEITALPSASGPNFFCTSATYSLTNAPAGANVSWSVSPSWAVSPSSGTGSTANISRVSNADATITFRIGCDNGVPYSVNFHIGDYSSSNYPISGPSSAGCNQFVYYNTNLLPGATNYQWSWPSSWSYVSGQGTQYLALKTGGSGSGGIVSVQVSACGGSGGSPATRYTSVSCFGRLAAEVFPNPASGQLDIIGGREGGREGSARAVVIEPGGAYEARLFNPVGRLVRRGTGADGKLSFNVQDLPDGVYILRLDDGGGRPLTQRVVVAH